MFEQIKAVGFITDHFLDFDFDLQFPDGPHQPLPSVVVEKKPAQKFDLLLL